MIHKVAIVALLPLLACPLAHADDDVASFGPAICQSLARDPSATTVDFDISTLHHVGGFAIYDAGFIVGKSVTTYCPQFKYVLTEFLNEHPAPIVRV